MKRFGQSRLCMAALLASFVLAPSANAAGGNDKLSSKQAVITEFASCVIKQAPDRVRAFLATPVGSKEEMEQVKVLMGGKSQCTKGRMYLSMHTGQARGALAESLIKSDMAIAATVEQLAPLAADRPTETNGRMFVMAYARCLTSLDPQAARKLIATPHGTPDETAAISSFGPALQDCMPLGLVYRINVNDVRNHVATALYDRAMASSGAGEPNA